jgi:hypothetical protein
VSYWFPIVLLAVFVGNASAAPSDNPSDKCAALDFLYSQARTEFPALANKRLDFGACELVKQEFTCAWVFPTYGFAAAEDQADKLTKCTAAVAGVEKLKGERGETRFQLNPETIVAIGRPEPADGNWRLTLRVVTTADWQ